MNINIEFYNKFDKELTNISMKIRKFFICLMLAQLVANQCVAGYPFKTIIGLIYVKHVIRKMLYV